MIANLQQQIAMLGAQFNQLRAAAAGPPAQPAADVAAQLFSQEQLAQLGELLFPVRAGFVPYAQLDDAAALAAPELKDYLPAEPDLLFKLFFPKDYELPQPEEEGRTRGEKIFSPEQRRDLEHVLMTSAIRNIRDAPTSSQVFKDKYRDHELRTRVTPLGQWRRLAKLPPFVEERLQQIAPSELASVRQSYVSAQRTLTMLTTVTRFVHLHHQEFFVENEDELVEKFKVADDATEEEKARADVEFAKARDQEIRRELRSRKPGGWFTDVFDMLQVPFSLLQTIILEIRRTVFRAFFDGDTADKLAEFEAEVQRKHDMPPRTSSFFADTFSTLPPFYLGKNPDQGVAVLTYRDVEILAAAKVNSEITPFFAERQRHPKEVNDLVAAVRRPPSEVWQEARPRSATEKAIQAASVRSQREQALRGRSSKGRNAQKNGDTNGQRGRTRSKSQERKGTKNAQRPGSPTANASDGSAGGRQDSGGHARGKGKGKRPSRPPSPTNPAGDA